MIRNLSNHFNCSFLNKKYRAIIKKKKQYNSFQHYYESHDEGIRKK